MDFLDPLYARRHAIRLYIGYVLVAIAIGLAVFILLLLAYGYRVRNDGQVIQTGLLFVSSRPAGASLFLDGVTVSKQTNTRLNIPEGGYELEIKRDGYRTWQHQVQVIGGRVFRYDYPLLFPETLNTTTMQTLSKQAPGVVSQSPDHRWLLLQQDAATPSFLLFDLKAPTVKPTTITLPSGTYTAGGAQSWQAAEWASDNVHLLLKHGYGAKSAEYVLLDRETPSASVNLTKTFKQPVTGASMQMIDSKFDHYYLYSAVDQTLSSVTISQPLPKVILQNVLEYSAYKADTVLYVTPAPDDKTKVEIRIFSNNKDYTLRRQPVARSYQVAISAYSGDSYVTVADPKTQRIFVYRNPVTYLDAQQPVSPVVLLNMASPTYLDFSVDGRFVLAERGTDFAVYDAEYKQSRVYHMPQPLDKGQPHATWLDGAHLQYASNKQLYVFDYDGTNDQLLIPVTTASQAFYSSQYNFVYTIAPPTTTSPTYQLTSTSLRTPADQ